MTDLSTIESSFGENSAKNRTIHTVTLEIQTLHAQAQQMMLGYAIEIGRRLTEAKSLIAHGGWGDWLKNETSFSKSTANNLMRIFEEYGDKQFNLFGHEAKSQSLGNLSYTQALKLLALPEEEREEFVESHDMAEMSSRELEKAVKERAEAIAEAERIKAEAEKLETEKQRLEKEAESAWQTAADLEHELEMLKNAPVDVAIETVVDHEAIETAMGVAREEVKSELLPQLEALEEAKKEAERKAQQAEESLKNLEEQQSQTSDQEEIMATMERDKEEAIQRAEALEKQLSSMPSQDVAIFKVHFTQVQEHINKMVELAQNLENSDPDGATKLKSALCSVLESSLEVIKR